MSDGGGVRKRDDSCRAVVIRQARARDAAALSALVWRLTCEYVLPDQPPGAADRLLDWMAPDPIAARIEAGHRYHVAEVGATVVGVVATRDNAHVYLLFVDTPFQRRGVARALWHVALAACIDAARPTCVTVNASAFAVPAYRRLGFVETGPADQRDDLISTPMKYRLD